MSFPRYPSYKASGVDWLGEVPEHWEVTALKRVVNPERQITYGIVQAGPHVPDGIPYIRPADMTDEQGVVAPDEVMRTSPEIASGYSRSTIREGDLVCSIGPSFGKVMVTPQWLDSANLTQGTARIAVQPPHNARYLFWTLRSPFSVAQWGSSVGGATFRALNLAPLAETTILVPTVAEQTHIAAFLDRETAKIDVLVAEQRRLMELLKEKRNAVISHAVTQGLNPRSPMKPSGIEWLGDVPQHWEVNSFRHSISAMFNGLTADQVDESESTVPVTRIETISGGYITESRLGFIERENAREDRRLLAGDILFSNINSLSMIGNCAIYSGGREIYAGMNLLVFRSATQRHPRWLYWLVRSVVFREVVESLAKPAINQASISQSSLSGISVPIPPMNEQMGIARYLDAETAKLDTLTAEAQRAIDLLQERRTALISAAVTGQIDVRGLAESEAA